MVISALGRTIRETSALGQVLDYKDFLRILPFGIRSAAEILRTKKLTSIDRAMSRNLEISYRGRRMLLPLADIDALLAPHHDNPTFGNLREMFANDCYLRRFQLKSLVPVVLDLGANRGLFSLIALAILEAEVIVGVEPLEFYEPVMHLLLRANRYTPGRITRYNMCVGSLSSEVRDPKKTISIDKIREEQGIKRYGMVKIDIEGAERDLFEEPDWLAHADNITMELHPHLAGRLDVIPDALKRYGFRYIPTDQQGRECRFSDAMFLYASCTGALH